MHKFKVGDRVKIINEYPHHKPIGTTIGKIGNIHACSKNDCMVYFDVDNIYLYKYSDIEPAPEIPLIDGHRYKLECLLECMFPVGEICHGTFDKTGFWFGRVGKVFEEKHYFKVLEDLTESEEEV